MNGFKISEFKPKKTAARMKIIEGIVSSLSSSEVFNTVDKEGWKENKIATHLHNFLRKGMENIFQELHPGQSEKGIAKRVEKAVLWEGAHNKTISANKIFGSRHYPDFAVHIKDLKIAVELKSGEGGSSLRGGIGQSLIYSMDYDFVIYILVDSSKDRTAKNNSTGKRESYLIQSLWEQYNIWLEIV